MSKDIQYIHAKNIRMKCGPRGGLWLEISGNKDQFVEVELYNPRENMDITKAIYDEIGATVPYRTDGGGWSPTQSFDQIISDLHEQVEQLKEKMAEITTAG
jgi:hypothetical protein